jgi:hypothetical protein
MTEKPVERGNADHLVDGRFARMTVGSIGPQQRGPAPADSKAQTLSPEWRAAIRDSLRHGREDRK